MKEKVHSKTGVSMMQNFDRWLRNRSWLDKDALLYIEKAQQGAVSLAKYYQRKAEELEKMKQRAVNYV